MLQSNNKAESRFAMFFHKNVSKILATINFSRGEIDGKFLSVWKNFIGNINSSQTSRLNLDKFGIRKDIPDCRSAPFA